jgi:cytochrome c peroxidase
MRSRMLLALSLLASSAVAQTFFPPPPVPAGNPVTQDKALLGMALFWEEQMSSSNTMACGTCHVFSHGGADPRGTAVNPGADGLFNTADDVHASPGVRSRNSASHFQPVAAFGLNTQVTPRKAPSVLNAAYSTALFYDGRVASGNFVDPLTNQTVSGMSTLAALENLCLQPPLNPIEMGHQGRTWPEVANKIRDARPLALASNLPARLQAFVQGQTYPSLFNRAFGTPTVDPAHIAMALATYIRTLIADQSPFDRFIAGVGQLTATEQLGMTVFNRPASPSTPAPCSQCHGDITAASHQFGPRFENTTPYSGQMTGTTHNNFHNTGVRPIAEDHGRNVVTQLAIDDGRFKVPMLRAVALRTPYFHNGEMNTLADVVSFYSRGGDYHVNQDVELRPRNLTTAEQAAVVAFLQTLTDPRVQNEQPPFDRPMLGSERNIAPVVIGTGMMTSTGQPATAVVEGAPVLGTPGYAVGLSGVPTSVPTFLMWDVAVVPGGSSMFGLQLYLPMSPSFQAVAAGMTTSQAGTGFASASFPIPNLAVLSGFTLYGQWLLGDPQSALGFASSDAFSLTVQ